MIFWCLQWLNWAARLSCLFRPQIYTECSLCSLCSGAVSDSSATPWQGILKSRFYFFLDFIFYFPMKFKNKISKSIKNDFSEYLAPWCHFSRFLLISSFDQLMVTWLVFDLKFIYSENATKFCEIFTLRLSTVHTDKRWRFCQILWPSQNIWTLMFIATVGLVH